MKNRNLIFIIAISFIFFFSIVPKFENCFKNYKSVEFFSEPQSSDTTILDYKDNCSISFTVGQKDLIYWSFSTSTSIVNITVIAMTESNYNNFQNQQPYSGYIMSNGSFYNHEGVFHPSEYTNWYIVFYNNDTSQQSTNLTYDIDIVYNLLAGTESDGNDDDKGDSDTNSDFSGLFILLIILGIIGGVVFGIIKGYRTKKPKKRINTFKLHKKLIEIIKIDDDESDVKDLLKRLNLCVNCGAKLEHNEEFCNKCGWNLKDFEMKI